ncbi:MAG: transaldolase [Anaerolineales bacterium]|nr:transaldolase [Anaerolineales bacterium]
MSTIRRLHELGQSVWLDFISRELIETGELSQLIEQDEVRGVTSNPTIFEAAIAGTDQYSEQLRAQAEEGWSSDKILDDLIITDIRAAADAFLPLYEKTNGADGYVSVEVNPELADDTHGTLDEVHRLWKSADRKNVMIKIPATRAGIHAIQQAINDGINVNVTLIFSLERYGDVMEAYLAGLVSRVDKGEKIDTVASVASFFVSRVDSAMDVLLESISGGESRRAAEASNLMGKAAIANAKLAYEQFEAFFNSERFARLRDQGARLQRPLWASTSTKNPAYPDTYYVDNLIGPHTVNTIPPDTLEAFRDHGVVGLTLEKDIDKAREVISQIENLGISMSEVTDQLELEGVAKFAKSYENLRATVTNQVTTVLTQKRS